MTQTARQLAIANENRSIDESQRRAIAAVKPRTALEAMAQRLEVSPDELKTTLVKTVFAGCQTESQFLALVIVSNEYGLNPLTKEIYAFPAKGGGVVPMVSVDGWNRIMNDHPAFDGIEFDYHLDAKGEVEAIESVIYRKDRTRPTKVMEYMIECKRNTDPWNKSPRRMLRHRALMQGARIAFGFGGIAAEGDEETIDLGVLHSVSLPSNQSLSEALNDGIPTFDKETGEVIEEAQVEELPTDPQTGMTEVTEDEARELDRREASQAPALQSEPSESQDEAAAQALNDIDGPLDPQPAEEAAQAGETPVWAGTVQTIKNGIAAAKDKQVWEAAERMHLQHCVAFPQEVADEIEDLLKAKKRQLGGEGW